MIEAWHFVGDTLRDGRPIAPVGGQLWPLTTPVAAPAQREPLSDEQIAPLSGVDADVWLTNRARILDAIDRAGFVLVSNRRLFWLHPKKQIDAAHGGGNE